MLRSALPDHRLVGVSYMPGYRLVDVNYWPNHRLVQANVMSGDHMESACFCFHKFLPNHTMRKNASRINLIAKNGFGGQFSPIADAPADRHPKCQIICGSERSAAPLFHIQQPGFPETGDPADPYTDLHPNLQLPLNRLTRYIR